MAKWLWQKPWMDFVYTAPRPPPEGATEPSGDRPWREAGPLCLLASALYVLAFPGQIDWFWPVAFFALVPLLAALRGASLKRALLLGLAFGLPTHIVGFRWLVPLLVKFSGFPAPVCLLLLVGFALLQSSRFVLWLGLATLVTRRTGRFYLPFVLAFAVTEALVPVAFEWRFAAALHRTPILQQTADLWGATGVGVLIVGVNVAVHEALAARARLAFRVRFAVETGPLALFAAFVYGATTMARMDTVVSSAPIARVGLLQGNVPLENHPTEEAAILRRELAAHRSLEAAGADLIVWSEGALPAPMLLEGLDQLVVELLEGGPRVPTFVGAVVVDLGEEGIVRARNSAVFVGAGKLVGRYDKQVLLPFSEYLPFGETFPSLYALSPASGRFRKGQSRAPLVARGHSYGVVICYEDVLPGLVRETVDQGAELLVNLTNDAWFGDSAEPHAHLALAKLRAIESRRFLVRATNTGISAVVDPSGRVTARAPSFVETTLLAEARYLAGRTPYVRLGELPFYAAALALFALALRGRGRPFTPGQRDQPAQAVTEAKTAKSSA